MRKTRLLNDFLLVHEKKKLYQDVTFMYHYFSNPKDHENLQHIVFDD